MELNNPMIDQPIEWVYTPKGIAPDIVIPAIVRGVIKDGYIIDTENQKGIKVRFRDVRAC